MLVLEVAGLAIRLGVVDRGRPATRVGVVIRDAEERLLAHIRGKRDSSERQRDVKGDSIAADRAPIEHACDLFGQEPPPRAADPPLGSKVGRDGAKREARRAKLASAGDGRLLPLVSDEARAVRVQREAEWHRADAFAPSTLSCKRRAGSSANQAVLVLGRAVDDGADECVRRGVAVALAACADEAGTRNRHGAIDNRREHDVTRNSITPGDDEHAGPMLANCQQGRTQPGTFSDRRDTAQALDALPSTPCGLARGARCSRHRDRYALRRDRYALRPVSSPLRSLARSTGRGGGPGASARRARGPRCRRAAALPPGTREPRRPRNP